MNLEGVTFLLDADAVIDFLAGRAEAVALIAELAPQGIAISAITLMEISEGVKGSRNVSVAGAALEKFLSGSEVIDFDISTAYRAADVRLELRRNKRRIHERALDILIAATALEHGLTLVTLNMVHYSDVSALKLRRSRERGSGSAFEE